MLLVKRKDSNEYSGCQKVVGTRLSLKQKVLMLARVTQVDHYYAEIQDRLQNFIEKQNQMMYQ